MASLNSRCWDRTEGFLAAGGDRAHEEVGWGTEFGPGGKLYKICSSQHLLLGKKNGINEDKSSPCAAQRGRRWERAILLPDLLLTTYLEQTRGMIFLRFVILPSSWHEQSAFSQRLGSPSTRTAS